MTTSSDILELPPGLLKDVRHRIASLISDEKAYNVPAVCRRFGLADGDSSEAFSSKYSYVSKRVLELNADSLLNVAKQVAQEYGDPELIGLLTRVQPRDLPAPKAKSAHRQYYSVRTGKHPTGGRLTFDALIGLFRSEMRRWEGAGYLHEHFGYWCVDAGDVPGLLGADIPARILFYIGKSDLWPIAEFFEKYTEDDLFDIIEFIHDHISKPLSGPFHSYAGCGYHWDTFDRDAGQLEYRQTVNQLLSRYGEGYELTQSGEILELGPQGTSSLLETAIPSKDENVVGRVEAAILKFRRYRSSPAERRDAVRDLADVLEYLRPSLKEVLTKADESDLFNIANNFGIRHHKIGQKTDYDQTIWLSWMFYFYLATIHASVRLIAKKKT